MKILVGLEACCQARRINAFAGNVCRDEFDHCRIGREESSLRGIALSGKPGGKYSARLARRALARQFRRGDRKKAKKLKKSTTEAQRRGDCAEKSSSSRAQGGRCCLIPFWMVSSVFSLRLCASAVDFDFCCVCPDNFRQPSHEAHLRPLAGALRNHVGRRHPAEAKVVNRLLFWLAAKLA